MGALRVLGYIFIVLGVLLSITLFGAIIGIPLIVIGALLVIAGKDTPTQTPIIVQQQMSQPQREVIEKEIVLCPVCKSKNESDAKYCKKCGESLEEVEEEDLEEVEEEKPKKKR